MPVETKSLRRYVGGRTERFNNKHQTIASRHADLLRRVRAQAGLSSAELARRLHRAPSTVGIYVNNLVEKGFLFEGKPTKRGRGRPPTILALNPQAGRFIGVDFEARRIMAVEMDFSLQPLKRFDGRIAASDRIENILKKIEHAIETLAADDKRKVLGIGVGVPGVIDPANGIARSYKHIKGWENVPLVTRSNERFGVPVFLENNIRTMALVELWFGQGRGVSNFICLGVRSGIGAGIIVGGQIYRGADNRAGEISQWPQLEGISDAKSFIRLEETFCFRSVEHRSAKAATANLNSRFVPGTEAPLESLLQAAQAGHPEVLAILDRAAQAFGLVLSQLQCAFDPEKIILAGVLNVYEALFLQRLQKHLNHFAIPARVPVVVNSTLGEFSGALGAAALAFHEWKPLTA
jgi:predicted NBD/HSP70 family sugar kinase/DNA-binding CsgD family transcriptional regulator